MRHSRPTLFSAFATGFFWAGAGTLTAVGLYYYLAPPADAQAGHDNIRSSIADIVPGLSRWAQKAYAVEPDNSIRIAEIAPEQQPVVGGDALVLREAQQRVAQQQADVQAQRVLVRSIQQELLRVGCYAGSVDGNWSDGTRSAMGAFTDSVQVKLPLKSPDYILLTMLQGHARQACGANPSDKSQIAARSPRVKRDVAAATETPAAPAVKDSWTTTVVTSQTPAASSRVAAAPPVQVPSESYAQVPLVAPTPALPGRMAIGAPVVRPDGSGPQTGSTSQLAAAPQATIAVPAPAPQAKPVARNSEPVRVAAPPPRRTYSNNNSGGGGGGGGSSSRGSPFAEMGRNAP